MVTRNFLANRWAISTVSAACVGVEFEFVGEAGSQSGVGGHECAHRRGVAGQADHRVAAVIFGELHDGVERVAAEVAFEVGFVEGGSFVDE